MKTYIKKKHYLLPDYNVEGTMTIIHLHTLIEAPATLYFDLSRSIDLHRSSMHQTKERAIAGKQSGLIEKGESVTWEATHFFITQQLTSRISEMERPYYFVDEMTAGAFKSMWHRHTFQSQGDFTLMLDEFRYEVPLGIFGSVFDTLILTRYMTSLLQSRNRQIKSVAECEDWKKYLPDYGNDK